MVVMRFLLREAEGRSSRMAWLFGVKWRKLRCTFVRRGGALVGGTIKRKSSRWRAFSIRPLVEKLINIGIMIPASAMAAAAQARCRLQFIIAPASFIGRYICCVVTLSGMSTVAK